VGSWGFIGLAYGLAALVLGGYLLRLRGRLREATATLRALEGDRGGVGR
jgi:hypothetical protein